MLGGIIPADLLLIPVLSLGFPPTLPEVAVVIAATVLLGPTTDMLPAVAAGIGSAVYT
ncbi:hypothetical protein SDC9_191190 [bioreactor metagenome]|uniref:Uncharacterized protein n=1 Tax=bioreactor metagenome TaxID=1076179 RepID=A0A645HXM1_9ZZZZ